MSFITGTGAFKNPKWIRCRTGLLLHTVMENIRQRIDCSNNIINENCRLMPKFFAYSTVPYPSFPFLELIPARLYHLLYSDLVGIVRRGATGRMPSIRRCHSN